MSAPFDPYHKWLGIPAAEQPPHHYRLLGVTLFEFDPEVIEAAADRHAAYLQDLANGPHAALTQRLLAEIAAARICLLTPVKRQAYDAELRRKLAATNAESEATKPHEMPQAEDRSKPAADAAALSVISTASNPTGLPAHRGARAAAGKKRSRPNNRRTAKRGPGSQTIYYVLGGGLAVLAALAWAAATPSTPPPRPAAKARPAAPPVIEKKGAAIPNTLTSPVESRTIVATPPAPEPVELTPAAVAPAAVPLIASAPPPALPATEAPVVFEGVAANVVLWLDAIDEAAFQIKDGTVRRWSARTPSGNIPAEEGTKKNQPERTPPSEASGLAVVRFRKPAQLEIADHPSFRLGSKHTIAFVARGSAGVLLSREPAPSREASEPPSSRSAGLCVGPGHCKGIDKSAFEQLAVHVLVTNDQATHWRMNGELRAELPPMSLDHEGPWAIGRHSISRRTDYFEGELGELLVFAESLDGVSLEALERNLMEKWLRK